MALKLRGRLQFADGQLFGRTGRLFLRRITEHAYGSSDSQISPETKVALERFLLRLSESAPRVIDAARQVPFFLFTDASYEPDSKCWKAGLGGVLVNHQGQLVRAFSTCASEDICLALGSGHKKTIIFELELLAVCCAFKVWSQVFRSSPLVVYVDNNSARDVAISGSGRSESAKTLLNALLCVEQSEGILPWYQRIPSPSNIADLPSRERCEEIELFGTTVTCENILPVAREICCISNG